MSINAMTYDDLPTTLPIFPLEGVLLLPNGFLPLNIFEPRYVKMVDDALKNDRIIGMVQPDQKARAKGQKDAIYKTGCAGRITQFTEAEDGRYMIILTGLNRFTVEEELKSATAYRQVKADWSKFEDDMVEGCDTIEIDREAFFPLLESCFAHWHLECDWDAIKASPCETLLTALPMICPFDGREKQTLLEAKTYEERYEKFKTLLHLAVNSGASQDQASH